MEIDFLFLQRLGDFVRLQIFVAAIFDGADARTLFDERAHDDAAAFGALGLDANVIEETGLPEIQKVFLNRGGIVGFTRRDAEVNANRVAGDGGIADRFEALDFLSDE